MLEAVSVGGLFHFRRAAIETHTQSSRLAESADEGTLAAFRVVPSASNITKP